MPECTGPTVVEAWQDAISRILRGREREIVSGSSMARSDVPNVMDDLSPIGTLETRRIVELNGVIVRVQKKIRAITKANRIFRSEAPRANVKISCAIEIQTGAIDHPGLVERAPNPTERRRPTR